MSKYSGLINKLCPGAAGAASRALAEQFVSRFGDVPTARDYIEGLLREAGRIDAAIGTGEMTQEEGRALFSAESFTEQGIPPHVATEISKWGNDTAAATTDTLPTGADKAAAEPAQPAPQPAPAPTASARSRRSICELQKARPNARVLEGAAGGRVSRAAGGP